MQARRKPTNLIKQRLNLLARLLLIASLWNAPLPLLHSHDADVHDEAIADSVVDHLSEYHPGVIVNSHINFGWHWHLVLRPSRHPGSQANHKQCPYCPQDTSDVQLQAPTSLVTTSPACAWGPCSCLTLETTPVTCRPATTRSHYLGTYLNSVPLGTLLRVARC